MLQRRTKEFALNVIKFVDDLPHTRTAVRLGDQLLRAGTSVGANYRAASRARSRADFISKMGIVEEEADESLYWLELLTESGAVRDSIIKPLLDEGQELLAMCVASIRTAKANRS
jgi:four helix bundle protein